MHADNPVVDQSGHWKTLETIRKCPPETNTVTTFALVIEAIDLVNVVGFMIASKEKEVVGIFYFVRKKEANTLNAPLSPIHVIATGENYPKKIPQKQVVCLLRRASILKQAQKVIILSVDVTYLLAAAIKSHRISESEQRVAAASADS